MDLIKPVTCKRTQPRTDCVYGKDYDKFPECNTCTTHQSCRTNQRTKNYGSYWFNRHIKNNK